MQRFGLQLAGALDEVGDGDAFGNFHDGFADFFHHRADGAAGFVGTGTFLVEPLANAAYRREGAFDVPDDGGESNFLGGPGQAVAADDTAPALNDARGFEIVENLLEKALGNILLIGDGLDSDDALIVFQSQNQQCAKRIFAAKRQLHCLSMYNVHQMRQALVCLFFAQQNKPIAGQ